MKAYTHYQTEDFVLDPFFRSWVLNPDAGSDRFWNDYLLAHPAQKPSIQEARLVVAAFRVKEHPVPEEKQQASLRQLMNRMEEADTNERTSPVRPLVRRMGWQRYAVAAAVAFLLVSVGLWWNFQAGATTEYRTAYGEIRQVQLPDQSVVTLNANSRLSFPRDWDGRKVREVWLEGEAFFQVTKKVDPTANHLRQRFIVHTDDLNVEVLGTSFNVKERGHQTKVVLNTGKVKLDLTDKVRPSIYMQPGEMVSFEKRKGTLVKQVVAPEQYSTWRYKKLLLNHTTVEEVAQVIEETYGLKVTFDNPEIAASVLDGTSLPTDNQEALLEALATTLDIRIVREGNRLHFQK